MNLSEQIKKIRKEKNLSQDALAEQLNVTRQTVSSWENGKSYPDLEMIINISQFFKISIDQLVTGDPAFVQQIDSEKKKSKILLGLLMIFLVIASLTSFGVYRHLKTTNHFAFQMQQEKTITLDGDDAATIATGYFSIAKKQKIKLQVNADIDSNEDLKVIILNQKKQPVYQISDDQINDHQVLSLNPGSYQVQVTTNNSTNKDTKLTFDYVIHLESQ